MMIRRALAALALCFSVAALPALAGTPVSLNDNVVDTSGQVTLGELFDGAGPARDVVVAQRTGPSVVLDATAVQSFARRYGLDWDNPRGIARIIVRSTGPASAATRNLEILTYARSLATGEIVQPSDIVWAKAAGAPFDAPSAADQVIGMATRHPVRQGDAVASHDVAPPMVIKIGDSVIVTYADEGVTVTLEGRAMASAAVGDTLNVQNPASKKLIEAVATGTDQAVVGPEALRIRADRPQIASR
ncbi:MAG TPA: flagellar basal body P-ring formation chaperone FlgA [Caulobacteraceae bacterium]|jgi:flagella basal body P-ring formation protein FlgA|nr:flagellar basal body P-ring formation chaperone FlgA [Caulobacteraceae bacterium]